MSEIEAVKIAKSAYSYLLSRYLSFIIVISFKPVNLSILKLHNEINMVLNLSTVHWKFGIYDIWSCKPENFRDQILIAIETKR